ncbi:hypothetical protein [Ureibacillus endophyticus]|uniref:Uncharacterized protein n=1 Tax=Ureibacillus endophyticus TaxID=1978490 RepID=A0A494YQZ1_9BACL|nr:hypothetical protein [Lysinibacillus endophyticus]RKQ11291.1 hypothetical protein D8M03_17590 [Lysinibacillus endophyticus]
MTLPNIPCQTFGGKYFWDTLTNSNGWKLQQNRFTQHYRILDPSNIRQAWNVDEEEIWHVFLAMTSQQEHQNVIEHEPFS